MEARSKSMAVLRDYVRLMRLFYSVQLSQALKSPINFWTASLVQVAYYAAQFIFWIGIRSTNAGANWMSEADVYSFLITLSLVDNLYLFLVGRGSMIMMQKVTAQKLDSLLLWPRSTLGTLFWISPNWTYFPCAVLSVVAFFVLHFYAGSSAGVIVLHFLSCLIGVVVMNGISYLFRLTSFWSAGVTVLRNANPSYKIMVRPYDAFDTKVRLFLLTAFPALFITGVPSQIASGQFGFEWLAAGIMMSAVLWLFVAYVWRKGVVRYSVRNT